MEKLDYVDSKDKFKKPEVDNKEKKEWKNCMNFDVCGNKFLSEHKFHRLCPNCKRRYSI
tara:strand:+ start:11 stop:187 length:177 start_codon:yes stop_codon:yes gene_type:complete